MFSQKYLALELTEHAIRFCFLEQSKGRWILSQSGTVDLGHERFSSASFAQALAEILTTIGTNRFKLFVNILRRDTLINSSVLPVMPLHELDEVISGEVIKIPSFYGKEFDFTFAAYPYVDTKVRVIFCALYHELVSGIIEGCKQHKLDLQQVAVAPLSLLASAYTWGETQAEQMLVVVGETASYVVAFQNKQCKFFFPGSTGRSSFVKNGSSDKISMMGWITDINRTITSYFVAHGGQSVQKIYLIWDNEGALDLATELEAQLSKPVVQVDLNMFPDVALKEGLDNNPAYLVASLPAIAFFKKLKSEFSFAKLLESFKYKDEFLRVVGQLMAFAALCALIVFSTGRLALLENRTATSKLKKVKSQIALLETENKKHNADVAVANRAKEDILAQIRTINNLNRISWSQIFAAVVKHLPKDVSFTSFRVQDASQVVIEGRAYDIETIGGFMRSLGDIKFLQDIKMSEITDNQMERSYNEKPGRKTYSFEITAELVK